MSVVKFPNLYKLFTKKGNMEKSSPRTPHLSSESNCNFSLYPAVGGHVLECRRYAQNGPETATLYFISVDDDFGARVAKIINLEMYRN